LTHKCGLDNDQLNLWI